MNRGATFEHPTAEDLEAFALGRWEGLQIGWLEAHLESCEACSRKLAEVPDDHLVQLARHVGTQSFQSGVTLAHARQLPPVPPELLHHPRYRVIRLLGTGGMGVVYQAQHLLMERMVALKVISTEFTANPQAVERFQREVKAAARLSHPNIVTAFDAEQAGNRHLLAMEYVEGVCLDDYVARQGPLSPQVASDLIRQAALGLAHASEQGMTHRDIKPHNLMVTPRGDLKVLDFGLARLHEAQAQAGVAAHGTAAGMVLGTPDFMSPEQVRDAHAVDIRSDIYSLGCTLYFLLTGRPPFNNGTVIEKLSAHLHAQPPAVSSLRGDVPAGLLRVLDRMLEKDAAARYQTPGEVVAALAPWAMPNKTPAPTAKVIAPPRPTRRWLLVSAAALLLVGGVVAGAAVLTNGFSRGSFSGTGSASGRKVVIVVPQQQAWYADYGPTKNRLESLGMEVITASSKPGPCAALPDERFPDAPPIVAEIGLDEISSAKHDAVVFTGYQVTGFFGTQPDSQAVASVLSEFRQERKTLGAICCGQAVLAQHGILDGKPAAGGENLSSNFPYDVPGGPRWTGAPVETAGEGRIVTASDDKHAAPFAEAVAKAVARE